MITVSQLFIYPIKSLGGIELFSVDVGDRGFKYDRRWMLVDENNRFMTQRDTLEMALLKTSFHKDSLQVIFKNNVSENILIPLTIGNRKKITVSIWDDSCDAIEPGDLFNEWFSDILRKKCKLVYMPDDSLRKVDGTYAANEEITAFSDGYPILLIGQSSLDDLNSRLKDPVPINRFRPNMVFTGSRAFEEDEFQQFTIGAINFMGVKLCGRCVMTTIDQHKGIKNKEPLQTLSTYRQANNKIYFGQNLLHTGTGMINVHDKVNVLKRKEPVLISLSYRL